MLDISTKSPGLTMNQTAVTEKKSPESGIVHGFRKIFFHYDPQNGTRVNRIPCTAVVAGAAAAGAATLGSVAQRMPSVAQRMPSDTAERLGVSLADRMTHAIENTVKNNPCICGAVFGGMVSIMSLQMLGSSLKPLASEGIAAVRDSLRLQLQRNFHNIATHKSVISHNQSRLSELEPYLDDEKKKYKLESDARYQNEMERYKRNADLKAGELKGYVDGIFSQRQGVVGASGEADGGHTHLFDYSAGKALTNFINSRNYSRYERSQLLNSLQPSLSRQEYETVQRMLDNFPYKPVRRNAKGPYTTEYDNIKKQSDSEQRQMGALEVKVRELLAQYPVLKPNEAGEIPKPDVETFKDYMPE